MGVSLVLQKTVPISTVIDKAHELIGDSFWTLIYTRRVKFRL